MWECSCIYQMEHSTKQQSGGHQIQALKDKTVFITSAIF